MTIDFNKIHDAVQRRDEFLKEHPELHSMQEEINRLLAQAGSDRHKRNILLQQMMLESWYRITNI